jgi:HSP20 family molecular chaperone IbpA
MAKLKVHRPGKKDSRTRAVFGEMATILEQIRHRAYRRSLERGFSGGQELDDWLAAEREFCWPATAFSEDAKGYRFDAELPGFDRDEVFVTATPAELIVKAVRCDETSGGSDETLRWSQLRTDDVYRRIEFPEPVDASKVAATLKHGMLHVVAPKASASKRKPKARQKAKAGKEKKRGSGGGGRKTAKAATSKS